MALSHTVTNDDIRAMWLRHTTYDQIYPISCLQCHQFNAYIEDVAQQYVGTIYPLDRIAPLCARCLQLHQPSDHERLVYFATMTGTLACTRAEWLHDHVVSIAADAPYVPPCAQQGPAPMEVCPMAPSSPNGSFGPSHIFATPSFAPIRSFAPQPSAQSSITKGAEKPVVESVVRRVIKEPTRAHSSPIIDDEPSLPIIRRGRRPTIPKPIRAAVWMKYMGNETNGKCYCCEREPISAFNFECGHVVSWTRGGADSVANLRPICSLCNKSMGTRNLNEYKKQITRGYFCPSLSIPVPAREPRWGEKEQK